MLLSCDKKGACQLHHYHTADLRNKNRFSFDTSHLVNGSKLMMHFLNVWDFCNMKHILCLCKRQRPTSASIPFVV